ncbi:transposase [Acidobacteria bacterium AH-259-G07]|nr:transposase [Acidobacteria bacterium AH-259-G07]
MARLARVVVPGSPHHVIQRGIRRTNVFVDAQDRHVYERLLKEKCDQYGVNILSYWRMTNHVHLIAIPEAARSLGQAMRDAHGPYASYFNRKCGFSGHLLQARFHSCVLDETHFWSAIRYVERNPVRAGIVHRAEDYPWSSALAHCGLRQDPLLVALSVDKRLIPDWATWLATEQSISELAKKIEAREYAVSDDLVRVRPPRHPVCSPTRQVTGGNTLGPCRQCGGTKLVVKVNDRIVPS